VTLLARRVTLCGPGATVRLRPWQRFGRGVTLGSLHVTLGRRCVTRSTRRVTVVRPRVTLVGPGVTLRVTVRVTLAA
jgi:hypothetical protein